MKMDRRAVLSGASAAFAAPTAGISAVRRQAPKTDVGANAEAIVGRFIEMIRKTGAPIPTAAPRVRLHTEQTLSSYRNGIVTLPIWETTPPSLRKMMDTLAAMGGGEFGGEEFFRAIFNWFILPHEMTHWYEDSLGWEARRLDHYETELRCNRVAVAFWAEQPDGQGG